MRCFDKRKLSLKESSSTILLQLLRVAIGNDVVGSLPSAVDWREVTGLCFSQGVAAIAVDGLEKVEGLNLLDSLEQEALKYEWFGEVFRAEDDYRKYKSILAEFLRLCKYQEVKVLLLKGFGLSLNYPIPAHRPCGDIDIYLFSCAEFISQMVEKYWKVSVDRRNPHHYLFARNGVTFEIHITLMDVERHKNQFSDEQVFQRLIAEGCDEIEVCGETCFVPSLKLNSVYLLRHMAHHFAVEKITLRHILDWALFVKVNASILDWNFVYGYAEDSGCTSFLNCLNGICVESLGFASDDFPVRECGGKLQSRMLSDILSPEFKEEIPAVSNKLRYGIVKTRRILANRWKYRMVSDESLLVTIWNLVKVRLRHENSLYYN